MKKFILTFIFILISFYTWADLGELKKLKIGSDIDKQEHNTRPIHKSRRGPASISTSKRNSKFKLTGMCRGSQGRVFHSDDKGYEDCLNNTMLDSRDPWQGVKGVRIDVPLLD